MTDRHDVGVLLTPEVIGKTLYSHSAACAGKLLKLFITEMDSSHIEFETENGETGTFCVDTQGDKRKNWEAVSFFTAKRVAELYWEERVSESIRILTAAKAQLAGTRNQHPSLDDFLSAEDPNPQLTVSPSCYTADGELDEFHLKSFPPAGFVFPDKGTRVIAMVNYQICDFMIPAGTIGEVAENRTPGIDCHGYVGCVMYFENLKSATRGGLVVPWDMVGYFKFFKE
jgi:hypothetical protein